MTAFTRPVYNSCSMTVVAGELGLDVPGMRVGACRARARIKIHRHSPHPFTARRPGGFYRPLLAILISTAIMTIAAGTTASRMTMTGVTFGFWRSPGKWPDLFRISCTIAVTIDIVTNRCFLIVTGRWSGDDIPLRRY